MISISVFSFHTGRVQRMDVWIWAAVFHQQFEVGPLRFDGEDFRVGKAVGEIDRGAADVTAAIEDDAGLFGEFHRPFGLDEIWR